MLAVQDGSFMLLWTSTSISVGEGMLNLAASMIGAWQGRAGRPPASG